jgi:hypothetical protein
MASLCRLILTAASIRLKPSPAFGQSQVKFISRLSSFSWFASVHSTRGTTKKTKKTKSVGGKGHPQISQIFTGDLNCLNYGFAAASFEIRD